MFQALWSVRCPVKGSLAPVPYRCFGVDGWVPRRCGLCPYLFEGECAWEAGGRVPARFRLRVVAAERRDRGGLGGQVRRAVMQSVRRPEVVGVLFVVEGDMVFPTLAEAEAFSHDLIRMKGDLRVQVAVVPRAWAGTRVRVTVVVEEAGDSAAPCGVPGSTRPG